MDENRHLRLLELHSKPMDYQNLELFLSGRIVDILFINFVKS